MNRVFTIILVVALSGCATMRKKPAPEPPAPPVQIKGPRDQDPVYLIPQFTTAWVNPKGDDKHWKSGYLTADVVQKPGFTTRAEAELMGRPYVEPEKANVVIPPPGSSDGQEFNATTIAQNLATPVGASPGVPAGAGPAAGLPGASRPPIPRVRFDTNGNALFIYPGGEDGMTFNVETPLGTAILDYRGGSVSVTCRGKVLTIQQPSGEPARVTLE